jgi:flavin reductase (DIM6/NTAB) family NADH-FMN oxidoreductase RutF
MEKIMLGPVPYMSVMPTLLVGTNVKGKPNFMTAAWATVACMAPPMVCVAINKHGIPQGESRRTGSSV